MREKKESRQNSNFIQVYRDFIDDIAKLGKENRIAQELFLFLAKHMDNNNALCISMKALEEILGYSRQTLSRSVKYLKEKGWLCVLKSGTSNIYILNPEIVWTAYASQKVYCKFQTNVIVTPSENAEYLNNVKSSFKYKHIDEEFIDSVKQKHEIYESEIEMSEIKEA